MVGDMDNASSDFLKTAMPLSFLVAPDYQNLSLTARPSVEHVLSITFQTCGELYIALLNAEATGI